MVAYCEVARVGIRNVRIVDMVFAFGELISLVIFFD